MENLKSIKVKVFYEGEIKKITKKDFDEPLISEGQPFAYFLYFIFSSYPEITKKFLPGKLGFSLNNVPPRDFDVLKNNDEIKIISFL